MGCIKKVFNEKFQPLLKHYLTSENILKLATFFLKIRKNIVAPINTGLSVTIKRMTDMWLERDLITQSGKLRNQKFETTDTITVLTVSHLRKAVIWYTRKWFKAMFINKKITQYIYEIKEMTSHGQDVNYQLAFRALRVEWIYNDYAFIHRARNTELFWHIKRVHQTDCFLHLEPRPWLCFGGIYCAITGEHKFLLELSCARDQLSFDEVNLKQY